VIWRLPPAAAPLVRFLKRLEAITVVHAGEANRGRIHSFLMILLVSYHLCLFHSLGGGVYILCSLFHVPPHLAILAL
jgi:hypothetical protein